jgi:hypothetical protein
MGEGQEGVATAYHEWFCQGCGASRSEFLPASAVGDGLGQRHPSSESWPCKCGRGRLTYDFGGQPGVTVHFPFAHMPDKYRDATKEKYRLFHADMSKQASYAREKQERAAGDARIRREGRKIMVGG